MITMRKRRIMREKKLMKLMKLLILSASITEENKLHCRRMGRSIILAIISTLLLYL
jgi:hypothetical protein